MSDDPKAVMLLEGLNDYLFKPGRMECPGGIASLWRGPAEATQAGEDRPAGLHLGKLSDRVPAVRASGAAPLLPRGS